MGIKTHVVFQAQSILTQLIFEHSLRIRMTTSQISSSAKDGTTGISNITGKLQNLVTTDLDNIMDGRDILAGLAAPLHITLCLVFLYTIIGWSAFAALGVILVTLPLPGYVSKLVHSVQRQRLQRTDGRVQTVSEGVFSPICMGVITDNRPQSWAFSEW